MRKIPLGIVFAALFQLTGCASIPQQGAGGLKPSVYTDPPAYLSSFPLGAITESEMLLKSGPSDSAVEIDGRRALIYRVGLEHGVRTFSYLFENGVIVDVLYNDNGPYNGMTALSVKRSNNK